jgi:hypothetical protein
MRRSLPAAIVGLVGLILLVDFVVINPLLADASDALLELIVLLAAAAAVAGGIALVLRHWTDLVERRGEPIGSLALLISFAVVVLAGFYPGSDGASDPAVRWVVAAIGAPLVASIFSLVFIFLLMAMRRGVTVRRRETTVMLAAATVVVVLLLPLGGLIGERLGGAAGWLMQVPIGGVFRGLLIGTGIVMAVHAARVLLSMDGTDD